MTTRHLVDPELSLVLGSLPSFASVSAETLAAMRQTMRDLAVVRVETTKLRGVTVREILMSGPTDAPNVRGLLYIPPEQRPGAPAYLHMHGGGMVSGLPEMQHATSVDVAATLGCVVLAVDYRLAPEHPFPAGVEDCLAALEWLHAENAALGIDPARIAIGGESAGAGLAAATTLLNRARNRLPLALQILKYPMLDHRTVAPAYVHPFVGEFVWQARTNLFGWTSLLGVTSSTADLPAHASPGAVEDLTGLPSAFIGVGALDLFVEESIDYARRLIRAGVAAELHVYPGAYHAFDMVPTANVSKVFRRDWMAALAQALAQT